MDEGIVREILDELLPSLETLDTRRAAVLQFLKTKKLASEEELAPFFEQAANASNVRWRAVRIRLDRLLSSAINAEQAQNHPEQRQLEQKVSERDHRNIVRIKSQFASRATKSNRVFPGRVNKVTSFPSQPRKVTAPENVQPMRSLLK